MRERRRACHMTRSKHTSRDHNEARVCVLVNHVTAAADYDTGTAPSPVARDNTTFACEN